MLSPTATTCWSEPNSLHQTQSDSNLGSARVAERLGMTREAHLRRDWWNKGEWTDTFVYSLLDSDPLPARAARRPLTYRWRDILSPPTVG